MSLHIINKSPYESTQLQRCLACAQPGNSIIFIEDGVYALATNAALSPTIEQASTHYLLYGLKADIEARGLNDRLIKDVKLIDYDDWVDLVILYDKTISWAN